MSAYYGLRGMTYIVRDSDNNDKYVINSRNLCDVVRVSDERRAAGLSCRIVGKNKFAPGSLKNQLQAVSAKHIEAAREALSAANGR